MAEASMLENRLRKNLARLGPWAKREKITAFRLYDRDIPEWPYFIDVYGSAALVTEHVTPIGRRQSQADRAREHEIAIEATTRVLKLPADRVVLRTRERHASLERQAAGNAAHEIEV